MAADQYGVAAELARSLPPGVIVIGNDTRWTLTDLPRVAVAGRVGLLVHSARDGSQPSPVAWPNSAEISQAVRKRGDTMVEGFRLYRFLVAANAEDAVMLPRP